MFRLAVLASGEGTNLQAVIDAIAAGTLPAQLVGVFSDRPAAPALARARAAGIAATALSPAGFASRADFDRALFERIDDARPQLVACAGYMRMISEGVVAARSGRMVNLHPSLLPAFKGLRTHARALEAGVHEHGASVHFVTAELDGGPVIAQARVPVLPGDDADALAARVRRREHPLLLQTLRLLATGRITLNADGIRLDGRPLPSPLILGADDTLPGQ